MTSSVSEEVTWEYTVIGDFRAGRVVTWNFADRGQWSLTTHRAGPVSTRTLKSRANTLQQLDSYHFEDSNGTEHTINLKESRFVNYFAGSAPLSPDRVQRVILDHLVGARTVGPITLMTSIVDRHISVEIRGFAHGEPSWFYVPSDNKLAFIAYLGEYALVFPDWFFARKRRSNNRRTLDWDDEKVKRTVARLRSLRIFHKYTILRYLFDHSQKQCTIRIRDHLELVPYARGRICGCIPIPGDLRDEREEDMKEPLLVRSPEVVVTSPAAEHNLNELSRIWQDRFAKSVLVHGPAGSNKELFSKSIAYGNGRTTKGIQTISLGEGTPEEQARRLFGTDEQDGLIAHAAKSAIFVDEAHYPIDKPGVRAALLRVLEAGEYVPVGSNQARDVDDVMWIFASSHPLKGTQSLDSVPPRDFWTRMTHVVEIQHPLSATTMGFHDRKETVKDLFKFFWWDHIRRYFKVDPTRAALEALGEEVLESKHLTDAAYLLRHRQIVVLLDKRLCDIMAERFSRAIVRRFRYARLDRISIRGIRSMVSGLFSLCVPEATSGSRRDMVKVFKENLSDVVERISRIATLPA